MAAGRGARGVAVAGVDLPSPLLGRVLLVTGKEALLSERVVETFRDRVAGEHPDAEHAVTVGHELTPSALGELTAPSLFSPLRCVVVTALEQVPDASYDGLLAYAAAPSEDVALALVHGGGPRGSGLLGKLRKTASVHEVTSGEVKPWDLGGFVLNEARRHGVRIDKDGAEALAEAIGKDLRGLAAAVHQLASDFPGQPLTAAMVGQYFGGRAETTGFAVADAAFGGRRDQAIESLRWALTTGTAPVLVTSAFAGKAREVAAVKAGSGAGLPPWKMRTLRPLAESWTEAALGQAVREVARADADVKGASGDAAYALERLVLTITRLRAGR